MTIRLDKLAFASIVAAVLATACGASSSEPSAGIDEGATEVDPVGNDQPGRFVVEAAPTQLAAEPSTIRMRSTNDEYQLGQTSDRLSVGAHEFDVHVAGTFAKGDILSHANVQAGQTTKLSMALTAIKTNAGPTTYGAGAANYKNLEIRTEFGITIQNDSDGSRAFPTWPGKHHVDFGFLDGVDYEIAPGETKVVSLTDFSTRRVVRLKAPHRGNPAANCGSAIGPHDSRIPSWTVATNIPNSAARQDLLLNDGETIDFGESSTARGMYTLDSTVWREPLLLLTGEVGAGPLPFALGHLDVNDVTVNNGTKVKGTYDVWRAGSDGTKNGASFLRCQPVTGTGVDLPPGKYVVEVYYSTTEAGQKTDVHVVDVTP